MSAIGPLERPTNTINSVPAMVIMANLLGAEVSIATDAGLRPGTVAVDLEPPDAFRANHTSGHVRISSNEGQGGGKVGLRVGPEAQIPLVTVRGRETNMAAAGTPEMPLRLGSLSLLTYGAGTVAINHASVADRLMLTAPTAEGITIGEDVSAGLVIRNPRP
jgi:hypothetical protein